MPNNRDYLPAFSSTDPEQVWEAIADSQIQYLEKATGLSGSWSKLVTQHSFPEGYYQYQNNHSHLFIKCLPKTKCVEAKKADDVTQFVISKGINSIAITTTKEAIPYLNSELQFEFIISDFLTARFISLTHSENILAAKAIAHLHNALGQYPKQDKVKQRAEEEREQLHAIWQRIKEIGASDRIPKQALTYLLEEKTEVLAILYDNAQVIHGDLNRGNILIDDNKNIYFIDFENALSTWASPFQDIAFFIERNLLLPKQYQFNETEFIEILSAYTEELESRVINKYITANPNLMSQLLKAISIKCLLTLSYKCIEQGLSVSKAEWDKFINNYHLACRYSAQLKQAVLNFNTSY